MASTLFVNMYTPSPDGKNNMNTVNIAGMKYIIIFCCAGSPPCMGISFCCTKYVEPITSGKMKYGSGADRSGNHKNGMLYSSTAVWSVVYSANHTGIDAS